MPPAEDAIAAVLGPGGLLAEQLSAYEVRPMQLTMARAVERSMAQESRLVVEAGTGTGKTLAYLAPAVLSGLKVVVSTGTKTLQEQIFRKDLPLLLQQLDADLPIACMKGLSNYLCLRRLDEYRRSGAMLIPDPELAAISRWAEETETGDRSELSYLPDDGELWREVSPTSDTRLGPRCPHYEDCFVTRMRRKGQRARVVVVNHHLLFADLVLRAAHPDAAVLPAYEALVLDEAHQLEDIATSFFGHSVSSAMVSRLAHDVRRAAVLDGDGAAERLADRVEQSARELFFLLSRSLARLGPPPRRGASGGARIRLRQPPLVDEMEQPYFTLDAALEALHGHHEGAGSEREDLTNLARRAQRLRDGLALFDQRPGKGFILWAEQQSRGSFRLHASPVEVGPLLQQTLLAEAHTSMVFTSATLATSSRGKGQPEQAADLGYFRQRLGLDDDEVEELVLPSPFDFDTQALLYLARDLPRPNHPDFVERICRRIEELLHVSGGRALVLFTSYRNLRGARELLDGRLPWPLLCQGDRPRSALLERFRQETSSVLLATASFWEGVDVVGESLSLVIMDKLPFAVPDDPLTAARMELLREAGKDPFDTFQLPQAALALKQGFGRLIRHRSDRGVVAMLDCRLVQSRYGKVLLDSLPPCPRTSDLNRVAAFFKAAASQP